VFNHQGQAAVTGGKSFEITVWSPTPPPQLLSYELKYSLNGIACPSAFVPIMAQRQRLSGRFPRLGRSFTEISFEIGRDGAASTGKRRTVPILGGRGRPGQTTMAACRVVARALRVLRRRN